MEFKNEGDKEKYFRSVMDKLVDDAVEFMGGIVQSRRLGE